MRSVSVHLDAKVMGLGVSCRHYQACLLSRVYMSSGRKPKIACLGLALKLDIGDFRESAAVQIADALLMCRLLDFTKKH